MSSEILSIFCPVCSAKRELRVSFKQNLQTLYSKLEECSITLLNACSLYLGMEENWLSSMAYDGNTILRIIHYPPLMGKENPSASRAGAHEDINLITLLVAGSESGLQVLSNDGDWVDVSTSPEYIVVNIGDMLQECSDGYYPSTTHRVINPSIQNTSRYSMPFFVHARDEVQLSEKYTAKLYLEERLREIGLK